MAGARLKYPGGGTRGCSANGIRLLEIGVHGGERQRGRGVQNLGDPGSPGRSSTSVGEAGWEQGRRAPRDRRLESFRGGAGR